MLLRDDGEAVAFGLDLCGQPSVPARPDGTRYVTVAAGNEHTVLLRDDGEAIAFGVNLQSESTVPVRPEGSSCGILPQSVRRRR